MSSLHNLSKSYEALGWTQRSTLDPHLSTSRCWSWAPVVWPSARQGSLIIPGARPSRRSARPLGRARARARAARGDENGYNFGLSPITSRRRLEVKPPTIWTDEKQRWIEMGRVRAEKRRKEMIPVREQVGKSRFIVFFQCFVAPEGRKVGVYKW